MSTLQPHCSALRNWPTSLPLTHGMENLGLSVFLPQRDGLEYQTLTNLPPGERNARIYELDIKTLKSCPILVAILMDEYQMRASASS